MKTYQASVNGRIIDGLTATQINRIQAQGKAVIILKSYATSEADYNSIALKESEC